MKRIGGLAARLRSAVRPWSGAMDDAADKTAKAGAGVVRAAGPARTRPLRRGTAASMTGVSAAIIGALALFAPIAAQAQDEPNHYVFTTACGASNPVVPVVQDSFEGDLANAPNLNLASAGRRLLLRPGDTITVNFHASTAGDVTGKNSSGGLNGCAWVNIVPVNEATGLREISAGTSYFQPDWTTNREYIILPQGSGVHSYTFTVTGISPLFDSRIARGYRRIVTSPVQPLEDPANWLDGVEFSGSGFGPENLTLISGDDQVGTVGTALATNLRVRVTTRFGDPVQYQEVRFTASSGTLLGRECTPIGAVGNHTCVRAETDADGYVQVGPWTLGTEPGEVTVTARAQFSPNPEVVFSATAAPPAPTVTINVRPPSSTRPAPSP